MNTVSATRTVTAVADRISPKARIAGRIITGLVVAFLLFDAVIHLSGAQQVKDSFDALGVPAHLTVTIGLVMLGCLALYLIPATAPLGAVLLTGYLGGAVTVNMINEKPLISTTLFAIYVGVFVWAGLYLRDSRVRALAPWNR